MIKTKSTIFVTGGAGFIGSALIKYLFEFTEYKIVNIDKLTYASNLSSLDFISSSPRYHFKKLDINDRNGLNELFAEFKPQAVFHLAAESHVDRSINSAKEFIETNVLGSFQLLEATRSYIKTERLSNFKFLHVSTDEVYGDLGHSNGLFTEDSAYAPSSPYAASKAASDLFVKSWIRTYDFPAIITNCSNNYGEEQCSEKLIPLVINKALRGETIPVYGNGLQIRDWLYVGDHVKALVAILERGTVGESYNIGGNSERTNIEVVKNICRILEELLPSKNEYHNLISFVSDRPGHDIRYAIDASKIQAELEWLPSVTFDEGLNITVKWYVEKYLSLERDQFQSMEK